MRGENIKATMHHDGGAFAQCGYCGRYSDNPGSLTRDDWPCDCGNMHGWSGSFKKPTADSKWSEAYLMPASSKGKGEQPKGGE